MLGIPLDQLLARVIVLAIAFTVHEFAHAWTADHFGDDTPRINGRLTLNPLAHLDPIGSLLLLVAGFGWAKPVPVNPYALGKSSPLAMMWVSLAGPMSNFLMAILAAIPVRIALASPGFLDLSQQPFVMTFLENFTDHQSEPDAVQPASDCPAGRFQDCRGGAARIMGPGG